MTTQNVGQLLLAYRRKTGMTQRSLAYLLGTYQNQISRWERGIRLPNQLRWEDIKRRLRLEEVLQS